MAFGGECISQRFNLAHPVFQASKYPGIGGLAHQGGGGGAANGGKAHRGGHGGEIKPFGQFSGGGGPCGGCVAQCPSGGCAIVEECQFGGGGACRKPGEGGFDRIRLNRGCGGAGQGQLAIGEGQLPVAQGGKGGQPGRGQIAPALRRAGGERERGGTLAQGGGQFGAQGFGRDMAGCGQPGCGLGHRKGEGADGFQHRQVLGHHPAGGQTVKRGHQRVSLGLAVGDAAEVDVAA